MYAQPCLHIPPARSCCGIELALTLGTTRAYVQPQYVRDRLNKTFLSIAGGLGVTALTAFGAFSSGAIMRAMAANPMMFGIGSFVLTIGSMFGTMYGGRREWFLHNTVLRTGVSRVARDVCAPHIQGCSTRLGLQVCNVGPV